MVCCYAAVSGIVLQSYKGTVMFTAFFFQCAPGFRLDTWFELSELLVECRRRGRSNWEITDMFWKHQGIWV